MCNARTQGIQKGCGHYVAIKTIEVIDCCRPNCRHSAHHACGRSRSACACVKYYGPDVEEIVRTETAWCDHCSSWYEGKGAPRKR
ncbi:hypothetical protein K523DRAFT_355784 [Schizophyllum commune Tattone D]|nr:hypothetical protein K523DRAFT_355784 [Schizophyllum commune Tattone D]